MAWEGPWAIDGDINTDVRHPAALARLITHVAFEGLEGVVEPLDLRVQELSVPGTAVRVMPGACAVRNRAQGGQSQSYAARLTEPDVVPISPTDSSGPRTDLIMARVENPFLTGEGWQLPPDAENGPYIRTWVEEGVHPNINTPAMVDPGWSAIPLARVRVPASTGTITQGMISDLRSLADPSGQRITVVVNPPAEVPPIASALYTNSRRCDGGDILSENQFSFINWPLQAAWNVPIPSWASVVGVMVVGTPATRQHAWGEQRLMIDGSPTAAREFDFNMAPDTLANVYRPILHYGGEYLIGSGSRGRVVTIRHQARSKGGTRLVAGAEVGGTAACHFDIWLHFQRKPT